jgi:hypothetical protein
MSPAAPEFTPSEDTTTNRAQQSPPQENVKIKGTFDLEHVNVSRFQDRTQIKSSKDSLKTHKKDVCGYIYSV